MFVRVCGRDTEYLFSAASGCNGSVEACLLIAAVAPLRSCSCRQAPLSLLLRCLVSLDGLNKLTRVRQHHCQRLAPSSPADPARRTAVLAVCLSAGREHELPRTLSDRHR
jgi:hypothetical protein